MSFWIILLVGILEGLLVHPLVYGHGWGKKGDMVVATLGAFISTILYFHLDFPIQNEWGVIFTSMIGATLVLFAFYNFSLAPEPEKRSV